MISASRPTQVRYFILALTVLVAVMLYLDRYCLGFVAGDIKNQLRLSQAEIDWLQSAFFITYAVGQIPCGWLSDRFGTRAMLTLYLFIWSMLTGLMGLATSFAALLLFRLGCGLFEAGAYPACAGLIRRWIPFQQRGLASGIVSLGGRVGGSIAFPLTAFLMVAFIPVTASSLFRPADLLQPRQLARDLLQAPANNDLARQMDEHLRVHWTASQQQFLKELADETTEAVTPAQEEQLAALLNEALRQPGLSQGVDLQPFADKLPAEVLRWSAAGTATLTPDQLARHNRLLLEVAYHGQLCKLYGEGWRPALLVFGGCGVLLAGLFWLAFRNSPRQHPLVNEAEALLIAPAAQTTEEAHDAAPVDAVLLWRGILTSPSLWLCSFVQFGINFGWVFLGTKLSEYLETVHQVPKIQQGLMMGLPFFLSLPMLLVGGWWTDRLTKHWGPRLGRALPLVTTRFVVAAAFLACLACNAPWPIIVALCVVSVASDMGLPAIWAYNLDVGGRNVGLILGWGNMWGNLGAAASPPVLGLLQQHFGWNAVFWTCSLVFALIGVAAMGIDATKLIVASPRPVAAPAPASV
jgi:MFS family permease